ncbi:MAG: metal ABC transporter ATP-binding protein [Phycisphaerales bacterium]|jgi:manganese/zinc/iron transport system ATP- binding protein|nr:metal ABC transporter ATP-binding protein [Phycisphaerales bacterium]
MDRPPSNPVTVARGAEHDPDAALSIHDLTVAYDRRPVLWDVDLDVPAGCLAAIVGPNGSGKSTLIKACLNLLPRVSGDVRVFGASGRSSRRRVAYVPQRETVDWDFPVSAHDVVAMGTYGRLGWLRPVGKAQKRAAMRALDRVGLADYAGRQISQLSGGQQQRVFLARALVQEADLYLMDEPFASVDAATEQAIVEVLRALRNDGATLVVVHHDLQTVAEYFEHLILLNMRVVASGPMEATLTAENLRATYGGRLTLLEQAATALGRLSRDR